MATKAAMRSAPRRDAAKRGMRVGVCASKGFGKRPEPSENPRRKSAQEQQSQQFDQVVQGGGKAYAVFVRIRGRDRSGPGPSGTYQWFPVGSVAVQDESAVEKAIYRAEKPLLNAAFKMYPQLAAKKNDPGLEYGFRLRDARQMSESEIRAGGDPFANVVVAQPPTAEEKKDSNPILDAMGRFERWVVKGQ